MRWSAIPTIIRTGTWFVLFSLIAAGLMPVQAQGSVYDSIPPTQLPSELAIDWINAVYERVRDERLNPPEASRIYGYMGVTLYEAVIPGWAENRSLSGQLNGLGAVPSPEDAEYDWLTVMNSALRTVMVDLMLERGTDNVEFFNALFDTQLAERSERVEADILDRSVDYGEEIGKMVVDWANTDGYTEMAAPDEYVIPDFGDMSWVQTTPNTLPVEPFWGSVRPFMLDFLSQCYIYPTMYFDTNPESTFYQQALEVMRTVDTLTPEQRDIALWWMDDPGDTGLPSGHWVEIATYILEEDNASLLLAGEVMGMLGPVLADSFITAWGLKYETNLLRPVTYINEYISPRWQPQIETPFFPEYPSAHSVVSAASADILDFFFGTRAFTDRANEDRGLGVRSFLSFEQAAQEAGISRLYGGIHYRDGIERGFQIGECVAQNALDQTIMRPFQQG